MLIDLDAECLSGFGVAVVYNKKTYSIFCTEVKQPNKSRVTVNDKIFICVVGRCLVQFLLIVHLRE